MPIIYSADFPSKGKTGSVPYVMINPMTYKDMMEYDKEFSNTYLQKVKRDINLLSKDISNLDDVLFFDFDFLVFVKKTLSVANGSDITMNVKCNECGKNNNLTINTDEMKYIELDELTQKIEGIYLGDKKLQVEMPTMSTVKKVLDIFFRYNEDITQEVFLLCCMFPKFLELPNEVKRAIEDSVREDIVTLDYISNLFSGTYKKFNYTCEECGKGAVVSVNKLMTDMFWILKNNIPLEHSKIIFS